MLRSIVIFLVLFVLAGSAAAEDVAVCEPGTYGSGGVCTPASPGHFVNLAGAIEETACPVGRFQPSAGAIECDIASPGHFVDLTGAIEETACPVGRFQPSAGAIECDVASPGHFVNLAGAIEETACPVGTYQPDAGADSCIRAELGTYADEEAMILPIPCPAGFTTRALGSTSASDCRAPTKGGLVREAVVSGLRGRALADFVRALP